MRQVALRGPYSGGDRHVCSAGNLWRPDKDNPRSRKDRLGNGRVSRRRLDQEGLDTVTHSANRCPNCGYKHATVYAPELSELVLQNKRSDVLLRLQQANGAMVTVDQLVAFIYGDGDEPETARNCVHTHVSRLKDLTQPMGWTITSQRNRGYRLVRLSA